MRLITKKKYTQAAVLCLAVCFMVAGCSPAEKNKTKKEYVPVVKVDKKGKERRFSDEQFKAMAKTPLDEDLLVLYVEKEWPIEKLKEHVEKYGPAEILEQNPIENIAGFKETIVYEGKQKEFDKLTVAWADLAPEDKNTTYTGAAATEWKRWPYSVTVEKDGDRWFITGNLPNDFMDESDKYVPAKEKKTD